MPSGRIYFDPDPAKTKDGYQGYADIRNGKYDTAAGGKGSSGRAVLVRIDGFGPPTPDNPMGPPLFVPRVFRIELPEGKTQKDFDVPASAAAGLSKNTCPRP